MAQSKVALLQIIGDLCLKLISVSQELSERSNGSSRAKHITPGLKAMIEELLPVLKEMENSSGGSDGGSSIDLEELYEQLTEGKRLLEESSKVGFWDYWLNSKSKIYEESLWIVEIAVQKFMVANQVRMVRDVRETNLRLAEMERDMGEMKLRLDTMKTEMERLCIRPKGLLLQVWHFMLLLGFCWILASPFNNSNSLSFKF